MAVREGMVMRVDENDFFRKATMRICSSLEIETAMQRFLEYLKDFIPVYGIFLHLYERDLGAMRTIAMATPSMGKKLDQVTPLPQEARKSLENKFPTLSIINQPELDPVSRTMLHHLGKPDSSVLILLLEVENKKIGALSLVAEGKGRFSEEHARLFSLLN